MKNLMLLLVDRLGSLYQRGLDSGVESVENGVSWVLEKLGAGENKSGDNYAALKYVQGTGYHKVGIALNQKEIAEYLDVSITTIRKWEKEYLPFSSLGSQTRFYDREACKS